MSKWEDVPKSDIEIDGDDIIFHLESDYDGSRYVTAKVIDVLEILKDYAAEPPVNYLSSELK